MIILNILNIMLLVRRLEAKNEGMKWLSFANKHFATFSKIYFIYIYNMIFYYICVPIY